MTDVMKGIRILEVAEHTFVPAASAVLADWGADVVKIEHITRGDAMRGLARSGVMPVTKVHVLMEHSNRGKRSLGLDLANEKGLEVLYEIAKTADVFLTNKLPQVLRKLKIDVDDIRAHNPDIIYVRGTAFGPKLVFSWKSAHWFESSGSLPASRADLAAFTKSPDPIARCAALAVWPFVTWVDSRIAAPVLLAIAERGAKIARVSFAL